MTRRSRVTLFCFSRGCERFAYYILKAALVGFLGVSVGAAQALHLSAFILAMFYCVPLVFGAVLRSPLQQYAAVIIGCIFLSLGFFLLAADVQFMPSILFLAVGAGLARVNLSSVFSSTLAPNGEPLQAEFTWLYLATNVASFMAPLVLAIYPAKYSYAFSTAGVSMIFSALLFTLAASRARTVRIQRSPRKERDDDGRAHGRLLVVIVLTAASILFWLGFEQKGVRLNQFASGHMMPTYIFGRSVSPSLLLSINPFLVLLLCPVFARLWQVLEKRNCDPNPFLKISLGLFFLGVGFAALQIGISRSQTAFVGIIWFVLLYTAHTVGELLLEPVGQDFVLRCAPYQCRALFLAIWDSASAVAIYCGALVAILLGDALWTWLAILAIIASIALWIVTPRLRALLQYESAQPMLAVSE